MPVNDWEDSWYDDPLPSRTERGRGGVVAVAVLTFVMCAFNAICASCLLFCGVVLAALENGPAGGLRLPGNLLDPAMVVLGVGIGSGLSFVLQIVAGIGLVNSNRWARILSFYLAGYSALMACFIVFLTVSEFTFDANMNPDQVSQVVFLVFGLLFHLAYAVVTFWVLLNRDVARTFR